MAAIISNARFVERELAGWYTHVYLHTDGDLLVKGNLIRKIDLEGNAFSADLFRPSESRWVHIGRMMQDSCFSSMIADTGLKENSLFSGRQEGSFFVKEVWLEIVKLLSAHYSPRAFSRYERHWPIEEVAIPTIARLVLGENYRQGQITVKTKEPVVSEGNGELRRNLPDNVVQKSDIETLLQNSKRATCVGIKWFSRDLDHPARKYVAELIRNCTA